MILEQSPQTLAGMSLLVLEDEILIADTIKRYLTKKQHEVVGIAISYQEAEKLYLEQEPDIVLLDIRISGVKTGIDFAHFIQKQERKSPFIYLTSQLDSRSIDLAKATFPAGYLPKPIQKESLYTTIEIAMHSHLSEKNTIPTIPLFDGVTNYIIPIQDILYLHADHIYVKVYLKDQKLIIQRSSLKVLLEQLPSDQFLQTHRSFAINLKQVNNWDSNFIYIQDKAIPISRNRKKTTFSLLKTE